MIYLPYSGKFSYIIAKLVYFERVLSMWKQKVGKCECSKVLWGMHEPWPARHRAKNLALRANIVNTSCSPTCFSHAHITCNACDSYTLPTSFNCNSTVLARTQCTNIKLLYSSLSTGVVWCWWHHTSQRGCHCWWRRMPRVWCWLCGGGDVRAVIYLEGWEHRDFPPLRLISPP